MNAIAQDILKQKVTMNGVFGVLVVLIILMVQFVNYMEEDSRIIRKKGILKEMK